MTTAGRSGFGPQPLISAYDAPASPRRAELGELLHGRPSSGLPGLATVVHRRG